jgi:hypothetical protein
VSRGRGALNVEPCPGPEPTLEGQADVAQSMYTFSYI